MCWSSSSEQCFQLMEVRAALGKHFIGFNTGRWDYINASVGRDGMGFPVHQSRNIDVITMTYGYMRIYEDRVRRACNTPDQLGQCALWQGGMEPNIPVGSEAGVTSGMKRAVAGAEREQREGASGKWVAHWKMVHIVRPVWEKAGQADQMGRKFPPLTVHRRRMPLGLLDARTGAANRARRPRSLERRAAIRQRFSGRPPGRRAQTGGLFRQRRCPVPDGRHGDGRNPVEGILWEWLHKNAALTEDDKEVGVKAGDRFSPELYKWLLAEEYEKLRKAGNRDVHDVSKNTTLPIAREIVETYVMDEREAALVRRHAEHQPRQLRFE